MAAMRTTDLGKQTAIAGNAALMASRKTFLWNQALFTMRRYLFYTTIGVTALIAEVVRMGFTYESTMQKAKTTLLPFFGNNPQSLQRNLNELFLLAAQTPFKFQDITKSFATLFEAFQPLGISAEMTRNTILGISNALVVAQRFTPQAINRVTLALQHMAYQGRLTGRMVNQLGQDGVPIFDILNKKLGLTGLNLHNISRLGIPTEAVLKAINSYLLTDPKFKNQAFRSQTATLAGAFSTFQDLLSQAASSKTGGLFSFAHNFFRDIDKALMPKNAGSKPVTMDQFILAIDKVLSPKTHSVLMFFKFFTGVIQGFAFAVRAATFAVSIILRPLDYLSNIFGGSGGKGSAARVIGYALGIILFVGALRKAILAVKALTFALRIEMATELAAVLVRKKTALWLLITTLGFRGAAGWIFQTAIMNLFAAKTATVAALALLRMRVAAIAAAIGMVGLTVATVAWVVALTAGLALIVLLIKYHKQLFGGPQIGSEQADYTKHPEILKHPSFWAKALAFTAKAGTVIPSFGGSFDTGGTVPGRRGSRQLIMAHGGETIFPTHKTSGESMFSPTIVSQTYLDGKMIAESVSKHKATANANR